MTDYDSKIIIDKYCDKKVLEFDNDDEIKIYLQEIIELLELVIYIVNINIQH